jgi:hypothetical protein
LRGAIFRRMADTHLVEVAISNPAHPIGLANFCRVVSFLRSLVALARAGLSAKAKYHTRPGQHRRWRLGRRAGLSGPANHREARDALKVGNVIGHERRGKGKRMRGNQQVHGANRLAGLF